MGWGYAGRAAKRVSSSAAIRSKSNQIDAQPAGRAGPVAALVAVLVPALVAAGNAKHQGRTLGGRFEIRPFREQSATRDLSTARRTHFDLEFALGAAVKAVDDRRPVSDFPHNKT